jgi:hypothetical protein
MAPHLGAGAARWAASRQRLLDRAAPASPPACPPGQQLHPPTQLLPSTAANHSSRLPPAALPPQAHTPLPSHSPSPESVWGKAAAGTSVVNLVNCILGASVLGYPYCFKQAGKSAGRPSLPHRTPVAGGRWVPQRSVGR